MEEILHQLRLVAFPISYRVLYIPGGAGFLPSTVFDWFLRDGGKKRQAHWPVIFLNALNAFALNLIIATTLKRLSAVAFVIIGIVKDSVIVATSSLVFGDHISAQQQVGHSVSKMSILKATAR